MNPRPDRGECRSFVGRCRRRETTWRAAEDNHETAPTSASGIERRPEQTDVDEDRRVRRVEKRTTTRTVIQFHHDRGGSTEPSGVAEHIAARENGTSVQGLTSQERKRVRIALYQCHLPRMDALGVVDFEKDRGTVALREQASQALSYLNADAKAGRGDGASNRIVFAAAVGIATRAAPFALAPSASTRSGESARASRGCVPVLSPFAPENERIGYERTNFDRNGTIRRSVEIMYQLSIVSE